MPLKKRLLIYCYLIFLMLVQLPVAHAQQVQANVHRYDSVIRYHHQINGTTVTPNLGSTIYLRNTTCYANDATITIVAYGGTPPYQFSLNGGSFQTNNLYTNLGPGRVIIVIQDAGGRSYSVSFVVQRICFTLTTVTYNAACGLNNGSIVATFGAANPTYPIRYSIDGINFQPGSTFTGLAPGPYTVIAKDALDFDVITTATVGTTPPPQASAQTAAATCANNDGSITIAASGAAPPFQYSINGTSYQSSPGFTGLASGSYTVMVKDANGCTASQPVSIAIINTAWANAGNTATICEGANTTLNSSSNGASFAWLPATGLSNAGTLNPVAAPAVTTQYTLTATLGGCRATSSVLITVNPAPIADAGKDTAICYGQSVQLNGSGGISYAWSPAGYLDNTSSSSPVCYQPSGNMSYQLTVTDVNNCRSINKPAVNITVTPSPKIFAGNDTSVYINEPVQLNAVDINNSGFTQYRWSPADGLSNPSTQKPVAMTGHPVTYTVVATTPNGCEGTGSISIKVFAAAGIFVPNAFTPDGDGHNDLLRAIPIGIREFKYLAVFNRWGKRIFYTTNSATGWNGTINGKVQDNGIYVWMAAGINYKGDLLERRGTVLLVR